MIIVSGTIAVRPEARDEAVAAALGMQAATRSEPGCRAYEFSATLEDPDRFRLFEVWDSAAALGAHLATPHVADFGARAGAWLAAAPAITRYGVHEAGPLVAADLPAPGPDDAPLGDVANRLLFENDLVRVWQMKLAPGEASDLHRHDLPYMLCVIEGESIDADWPDAPSLTIPLAPGDVFFVPPGRTETAVNRSTAPFHEILVEFKQPAAPDRIPFQHFTALPSGAMTV